MGTRASFWIGDPTDMEHREWLGCVAYDGYPSNFEKLSEATTPEGFREAVQCIAARRRDFSHPADGWSFPWANDLFLTDVTYALIGDIVQVCRFHGSFWPLSDHENMPACADDPRHSKIPAPASYNPEQPDSIMYIRL